MTCIVGIQNDKGCWIGTDSFSGSADSKGIMKEGKFVRCGKFTIGYTTSFRMAQIIDNLNKKPKTIYEFCEVIRDALKEKGFSEIDNNKEIGGTMIVSDGIEMWHVGSDFAYTQDSRNLYAIGSGYAYALGAMFVTRNEYPKQSEDWMLRAGLQVASECIPTVISPFHIRKIEEKV